MKGDHYIKGKYHIAINSRTIDAWLIALKEDRKIEMKMSLKQACRRMTVAGLSLLLIMTAFPPVVLAKDASGQAESPSPQAIYNDVPDQAYYLEALAYLQGWASLSPMPKAASLRTFP